MRTARLFRMVWRVNGVLLLLALLSVGGLAVAAMLSTAAWGRRTARTPAVVVANKGERLFLGNVQVAEGTSFVLLPLEAHRPGSKLSSGLSYDSETHNLLFYDTAIGSAHWLRADHTAVIVAYELLRESGAVQQRWETKKGGTSDPVRWIRYELATTDTNGDGQITRDDARQVAVSGPGGDGFTILLNGVDDVMGYASLPSGKLVVFFRRGGESYSGEIDLAARKLERTAPLPKS